MSDATVYALSSVRLVKSLSFREKHHILFSINSHRHYLHYHNVILRRALRKLPFLSANNGMASCMSQKLCAGIYLPRTPHRFDESESRSSTKYDDSPIRREPRTPKESHYSKATREALSAFTELIIWRMARGSQQSLESWHIIATSILLLSSFKIR